MSIPNTERLLLANRVPPAPGEKRRVLVVDDEPGMRYMARRVLSRRFEVSEAGTAEEGLELLETGTFHLAVVDVRLPGASGLELLTAIKTCCVGIDVIVMTGSAADPDEALEDAVRRQAFFFLRKPFPMTVLETLAERAAERQELEERVANHVRVLEQNLESARVFQERLLPPRRWKGPRIEIASYYAASERLSGDFFDYWRLPDGGSALFIADVMGHGASAAMITGIVKSQVRSLSSEITDPGSVLYALEEELAKVRIGSFLTALLVFDHPAEGELLYCGAGHPPALALLPGETIVRLESTGVPINTGLPLAARETGSIARRPDLRLLLLTDGYGEAAGPDGSRFDETDLGGTSPFDRAVHDALSAPLPEEGLRRLEASWTGFVAGGAGEDDRAAVLARLLPAS